MLKNSIPNLVNADTRLSMPWRHTWSLKDEHLLPCEQLSYQARSRAAWEIKKLMRPDIPLTYCTVHLTNERASSRKHLQVTCRSAHGCLASCTHFRIDYGADADGSRVVKGTVPGEEGRGRRRISCLLISSPRTSPSPISTISADADWQVLRRTTLRIRVSSASEHGTAHLKRCI